MLLEAELRELTETLKAKASQKELFFFHYLMGKPLPYPDDTNLSDQALVCYAAFSIESPDMSSIAEKLRGTKPIMGMHYSNNLIELAAFAQFDLKNEEEHLKTFASSHSTRDFFLLKHLFPSIDTYKPEPRSPIDQLASNLLAGDFQSNSTELILEAMQSAEDLLDLYVIHKSVVILLDYHPATQNKKEIAFLTYQLAKTIRIVDRTVHIILTLIVAALLVLVYVKLIPIILNKWEQAEPIWIIVNSIIVTVNTFLALLIGTKPEKLKFWKSFERLIGTGVLRLIGIRRKEVEMNINK